jgi:hypothetical protein
MNPLLTDSINYLPGIFRMLKIVKTQTLSVGVDRICFYPGGGDKFNIIHPVIGTGGNHYMDKIVLRGGQYDFLGFEPGLFRNLGEIFGRTLFREIIAPQMGNPGRVIPAPDYLVKVCDKLLYVNLGGIKNFLADTAGIEFSRLRLKNRFFLNRLLIYRGVRFAGYRPGQKEKNANYIPFHIILFYLIIYVASNLFPRKYAIYSYK